MNELSFKTNLKCTGCVNAIAPVLNNIQEITKWEVNLSHPDRILKVEGGIDKSTLISALEKVGYKAGI